MATSDQGTKNSRQPSARAAPLIVEYRIKLKLHSYLILLVVAAVVPVLSFAGAMLYLGYQQQREKLANDMLDRARAISAALDREFLISMQSLKVLGASSRLDKGELAQFYGEMKGAIAGYSRAWQNLTLTDASGQQLINLRRPFGAPLPTTGNPEVIVRVVRSKQPAIGNLSAGPVSGAPGIVVHVPVLKEGRVSHVLNAIFYPQPLSDLLLTQELPWGWLATIVDQNQIVAATNRESEKFFGKPAPRTFAAQAERHREIAWRGTADDGSGVVAALHRSSFSGWTVGLSSSAAVVDAPLRTLMIFSATGGLFLLLVALGLAAALGRRIAAPVAALSHEAERLGRGNTPRPISSAIVEIDRVARALEDAGNTRNEAERALRKSEKNLAGAQERARLGSWEYDIAARAGSWSAQMFRLFERDPTLGAPTLAEFLQMVHPDDRGLIEEAQARAAE